MVADKKKVSRLLKTARGQIDGILKMIEEDQYCVDISNQVMAAEAVLEKANKEIIKAHMKGCVKDSIASGNEAYTEAKIDEIIKLIDKLSK